jgi:acyl-coenzyme A synthetase/AMP-(fatty) acid ligase
LGTFSAEQETESGIFALRELHGRNAGLLRMHDGTAINCLYWNHLFKEFPEVRQFQVVVDPDENLCFLLKGEGFASERESELRRAIANLLKGRSVRITWVDQIPLTAQGKLVQVVRAKTAYSAIPSR